MEGKLGDITTYQAGVLQASTHRLLQHYSDKILKPYGITKMQWLIIGVVLDARPGGTRITDMAKRLNTTVSYLTTTTNLLESKGMLLRTDSGKDNRSKLVTIHPDFAPRCQEIETTLRRALRTSIYATVDPAEFRVYMKVLAQLSEIRT